MLEPQRNEKNQTRRAGEQPISKMVGTVRETSWSRKTVSGKEGVR